MTAPTMDLLWSYVYARKLDLPKFLGGLEVPRLRFFADSGAHSARTLGLDLSVDDYGQWCVQHQQWFTIMANLDVIGAPDATRTNQERLEQQYNLHPMPVFHTGEPFSVLEDYISDGYTYIALGKLLGNSQATLRPWLDRCFSLAHGRAVFHGFGLTVWPTLKRYPFYSVDSSSWGSGVRFGTCKLFDAGRWVAVDLRDHSAVTEHTALLASYGVQPRDMTSGHYNRAAVSGACALAQYRAAQWLHRIHGPIELRPGKGYPPADDPHEPKVIRNLPGTPEPNHQYLAESSANGHAWHAAGITAYLADSSIKLTANAARAYGKATP